MNLTVTKEKNFLNFIENDVFICKLDINSGVLIGKTTVLSRCPKHFKDFLSDYLINKNNSYFNILKLLYLILKRNSISNLQFYKDSFQALDKMNSLGYKENILKDIDYLSTSLIQDLKLINENFKYFCEYFKENPDESFSYFKTYYLQKRFFEDLSLNNLEDNDIKEIIWNNRKSFNNNEELKLFAYYITHGLYYYYECNGMKQTSAYQVYDAKYHNINEMIKKVKTYFSYCDYLKIKPKKDNNFFQNFINAQKSYITTKNFNDNNVLKEIYEEKSNSLLYENSDFKIVLPTTKEMLFDEGESQKNCVYNRYLKIILDKKCYVVFVRKKNDINKSYITCEVNLQGKIMQYLEKCNKRTNDEKALQFAKEYQEYLNENFNK